jgi:ceramide glucosyltransferase
VRSIRLNKEVSIDQKNYTIIQPILSGDADLKKRLYQNVWQLEDMCFFWLVDEDDLEGQKIVQEILAENPYFSERVTVVTIEKVPQGVNPKVFKMKQVLDEVSTEYCIVLDDDSVIDRRFFNEMSQYEALEEEWLVTGIPYNDATDFFFSRLVAAFVNSQSHLTYFTMAYKKKSRTINGMFYLTRTETIKDHQAFVAIEKYLCDDYELAKYLASKKVRLIQSTIPCYVKTTVIDFSSYVRLMKRWLVFTNHYMREQTSFLLLVFIVLPSILPVFMLVLAFTQGWGVVAFTFGLFVLKAFINAKMREKIFKKKEAILSIVFESISDLILPFLYGYALVSPRHIQWRDKKIKIEGRAIRYEE